MPVPLEKACDRTLARLDAWDELTTAERGLVEEHARACSDCADALELTRAMAASFRRQPRPECPPQIAARALELASREWAARDRAPSRPTAHRSSWMGWLRVAWQPALAAGLLAVVALLPAALSRSELSTGRAAGPSAAEIARAEKDLKLALAYFGRVTETAETTLRREMVDNVIAPTRRAWTLEGSRSPTRR